MKKFRIPDLRNTLTHILEHERQLAQANEATTQQYVVLPITYLKIPEKQQKKEIMKLNNLEPERRFINAHRMVERTRKAPR